MNKIKDLRKARKWTQKYLGELLGVNKSLVSKYERDLCTPSIETLKAVATIFNVTVDYLIGYETEYPLYKLLDLEGRHKVRIMINYLLNKKSHAVAGDKNLNEKIGNAASNGAGEINLPISK